MRRGWWPAAVLASLLAVGGAGAWAPSRPAKGRVSSAGEVASWYKDVQPIIQSRCLGCHVSGGISFSLASYEDVLPRHPAIASSVSSGSMPPWKPAEGCQSFRDTRRLSPSEIDTIVSWSRAGAPAGSPADASPAPPPQTGLPWVDAALDPGADYTPRADAAGGGHHAADDYHCFMLDPGLQEDRDLIGFDIQPGQRRLVHHILLFGASRQEAEAADRAEPGLGWTCFGGPGTSDTTSLNSSPAVVGGWVPGTGVTQYPAETGVTLPAGRVLVMQVHYNLTNGSDPDRTIVNLQYARQRVSKPALIVPIADLGFAIPPGASGFTTTTSAVVPVGATLWGVGPHMHTLGRQIKVEKDSTCLIDIPSWDFHWQQVYFFSEGLSLPAGSRLKLSCTWDNTTDRTIRWGESTSDEMCLNYLYLTF